MIVVDVETGGIDPINNPLLSIGAVDFENPNLFFAGKCAPYMNTKITDEALEINGIDIEEWSSNPPVGRVLKSLIHWLKTTSNDGILAGHNPRFDLDFIRVNCERVGLKCPFGYRTVDLHSLAYAHRRKHFPSVDSKLTSDSIYKYLGMPIEPRPHNALTGAKYEATAFRILINNERILL